MKKVIPLVFCLFAANTNASVIHDFTDGYDVSNWNQELNGGQIDITGAPLSVVEISADTNSLTPANTDFTITALGDGDVTFHWAYSTLDLPQFDPFGWLLNGVFNQVTDDSGASHQGGTSSFTVGAGDIFGFRAFSTDSCCGPATTIISNFSAPAAAVSEPGSLALFLLGLASIAYRKSKKQSV